MEHVIVEKKNKTNRKNTYRQCRLKLFAYLIQNFPPVDRWRNLSASASLGCDMSRYHRIYARQWNIVQSV